MAVYNGNNRNNTYHGTTGNDTIFGNGGDDTLYGRGGNDSLYGGSDNDTLNGGTGNDYVNGDWGNDTYLIAKNDGADTLYDSGGTDVAVFTNIAASNIHVIRTNYTTLLLTYNGGQLKIVNYFSNSDKPIEQFQFSDGTVWGWTDISTKVLQGTGGDDTLYGYNNSDDTLNGLAGNDKLYGYTGNDTLNGDAGNDSLLGDFGNDTLNGGKGNDVLKGDYGNDTYLVAKNDGVDTIFDNGGTDVAVFTNIAASGISQVSRGGDHGWDLSLTYSGGQLTINDYFSRASTLVEEFHFSNGAVWTLKNIEAKAVSIATDGNDYLYGHPNKNDTISGLAGNDKIYGYGGNDMLNGDDGNDYINAGAGNDVLDGGLGNDALIGGPGQDSFVFSTALGLSNIDTLNNFSVADDTIQLAHSIFTILSVGALAADQFKILGNGGVEDGNDHILYDTSTGGLSYDTDGNGAGAAVKVAILAQGEPLTSANFMVV